jgi:hypothetical protein
MNLRVPWKLRNLLTCWTTINFSISVLYLLVSKLIVSLLRIILHKNGPSIISEVKLVYYFKLLNVFLSDTWRLWRNTSAYLRYTLEGTQHQWKVLLFSYLLKYNLDKHVKLKHSFRYQKTENNHNKIANKLYKRRHCLGVHVARERARKGETERTWEIVLISAAL